MTDPGALSRRLMLEAPVETPDGAGGVTRAFATVATLWASVTPAAARDEGAGASITHRILIRAGPAITTRHRLREGARIYRIVSVRDHDAARRLLAIDAEQRTA